MTIPIVDIASWSDVHSYVRSGWLFRGQSSAAWGLKTSFERLCDRRGIQADDRYRLERALLRDFTRSLHQYSAHVPRPDCKIEWLSIMQHHGAPTRLLDFTYSLYVACYFALEAADSESAVWAIRGPWALRESVQALKESGKSDAVRLKEIHENDEDVCFELVFAESTTCAAIPLNPFRLNERLRIQKGVFLVPGNLTKSYMENLESLPESDNEDNAIKLVLSPSIRAEALESLFYMNISRTSLFPGLDGYAQSLGVYHPTFIQ